MSTNGGIFALIILALDIWAILKIVSSGETAGKKVLWIVLIIVLPIIGLIIWALAGPALSEAEVRQATVFKNLEDPPSASQGAFSPYLYFLLFLHTFQ